MNYNYPGYALTFIQQQRCGDETAHLYTRIYKFRSPVTGYLYIVRAEYQEGDVFAVKFYCKSDNKYAKIVNRGDVGNIIMSCARVIPELLATNPTASFAFAASPSVDSKGRREPIAMTQRYRIYCDMIPKKFGAVTFAHYAYDNISSYLLYNRTSPASKADIEAALIATYPTLDQLA